jgi:hypothetical protein
MWGFRCLVVGGPVVGSTALLRPQLGPVGGQVGVDAVRMLLQSKTGFLPHKRNSTEVKKLNTE